MYGRGYRPLEAAGGWVKPLIEEAMDRNRRPKPETMNAPDPN